MNVGQLSHLGRLGHVVSHSVVFETAAKESPQGSVSNTVSEVDTAADVWGFNLTQKPHFLGT